MTIPTYSIKLPQYQVMSEPDHRAIGTIVDNEIRKHFLEQTIVVRGLSTTAHQDKTIDELISVIKKLGTDHYDPERVGDRYENIQNKHIDFFGFRRRMTPTTELFKDLSWGFYHSARAIHGKPVRLDILLIYDATELKAVPHQYEGRDDLKRDGFVFRDPKNKADALQAILKLES